MDDKAIALARGALPLPLARVLQLANEHLGIRLITDVDYDLDSLFLRDLVARKTSNNHSRPSPNSILVRKVDPFIISHRSFTVDDVEEVFGHASPFVSLEGLQPLFIKIVPGGTWINIETNRRQSVQRSRPAHKTSEAG